MKVNSVDHAIRNQFNLFLPEGSDPIVAAWLEPLRKNLLLSVDKHPLPSVRYPVMPRKAKKVKN